MFVLAVWLQLLSPTPCLVCAGACISARGFSDCRTRATASLLPRALTLIAVAIEGTFTHATVYLGPCALDGWVVRPPRTSFTGCATSRGATPLVILVHPATGSWGSDPHLPNGLDLRTTLYVGRLATYSCGPLPLAPRTFPAPPLLSALPSRMRTTLAFPCRRFPTSKIAAPPWGFVVLHGMCSTGRYVHLIVRLVLLAEGGIEPPALPLGQCPPGTPYSTSIHLTC